MVGEWVRLQLFICLVFIHPPHPPLGKVLGCVLVEEEERLA